MLKNILWNKFALRALIFLLMQQLIVASSTIWITRLSETVVSGQPYFIYLVLFVGSLFMVYLPGMFAAYQLERAKNTAFYRYTEEFSAKYRGIPTAMGDKEFQAEKEPWLTGESTRTIEESYGMAYDSAATGLNTLLNVLALCFAIDRRFLIGYALSFILLPIASRYFRNKLADAAVTMQDDRKSLYHILLSGWDNIIIGNTYNLNIWWKQYSKRWALYNDSSTKAVVLTQISSTCSMVFSLIPVAGVFLWLFLTTSNTGRLVALVATLPRQIQIIQHFEILSTYVMHWHGVLARLKSLFATIDAPLAESRTNILKRINKKEINILINQSPVLFSSLDELFFAIGNMQTGRVTINGKNGSGKTTLINLIKKELGDQSYYLPTNSRLLFESSLEGSLSTGQEVKSRLDEIIVNLTPAQNKILLLDEWDANLDVHNIKLISTMLDSFAKERCIIEIRH